MKKIEYIVWFLFICVFFSLYAIVLIVNYCADLFGYRIMFFFIFGIGIFSSLMISACGRFLGCCMLEIIKEEEIVR